VTCCSEVTRLEKALRAAAEVREEALKAKDEEIGELQKTIASLRTQAEGFEARMAEADRARSDVEERLSDFMKAAEERGQNDQSRIRELEGDLAQAIASKEQADAAVAEARQLHQQATSGAEEEGVAFKARIGELEGQVKSLEEELSGAKAKLVQLDEGRL
jgi:chromosome segregation ATPase